MQYAIPQFIEIEDRVIGPLTIRQFLMILGGALLTGAGYSVFDFSLFIFVGVIVMGIASLFAFLKINGQNFEKFLMSFIAFSMSPKLRLWAKEINVKSEKVVNSSKRDVVLRSNLKDDITRSKLQELSILLDASSREYIRKTHESTDSKPNNATGRS